MIEKIIKISADTKEAADDIRKLFKDMVKQEKEAQKQAENLQSEVNDIGKVSKNTSTSVKSIGKAFSGVGLAMKALGIGLLLSALATMKDLFSQNQRVVDIFSTAFETMSIVINQVTDALFNVYDSVSKNSENFDALGKVLGGINTIHLTPLKLSLYAIKLALQEANLAWEKSIFGGNDYKKILELTLSVLEIKRAINEVGEAAIQGGKDIVVNFSEAVTESGNIGTLAIKELSKVSVSAALEQAKSNKELKNGALLAAAEQNRLVEIYGRQAEKLRQTRDADLNSIETRKKANEELADVLDKQEKAMLAAANAQVASAEAMKNTNNSIENQVALTEALANKEGVLAQIEDFRSEQLKKRNSLLRQEYSLNLSIAKGEDERRLAQLEYEESTAESEDQKLEKQKKRLELENELLLEDIEAKREIYAEGTQARIDAENDYDLRSQGINNELLTNKKATTDAEKALSKESSDDEIVDREKLKDMSISLTGQTLDIIGGLAKEGSALAKGVAVAQATMSTYQAAVAAYAAGLSVGGPAGLILAPVAAGVAVVAGLANIKKILSTKPIEKGAPSGGASSGASVPSAPSFNLVEGSGSNQIAEGIAGQSNQPLKAYVVSGEVTTAQSMDRNIVNNSGF